MKSEQKILDLESTASIITPLVTQPPSKPLEVMPKQALLYTLYKAGVTFNVFVNTNKDR